MKMKAHFEISLFGKIKEKTKAQLYPHLHLWWCAFRIALNIPVKNWFEDNVGGQCCPVPLLIILITSSFNEVDSKSWWVREVFKYGAKIVLPPCIEDRRNKLDIQEQIAHSQEWSKSILKLLTECCTLEISCVSRNERHLKYLSDYLFQ